ncbi:MAG: PilN domain-containing protein [Gammaproteobacteria bacterium]|nr:PilN domain-containing protein [Gammaproteobacteria bacterium]
MAEIDLIPLEFHRKFLYLGWLKKAVLALVLLSLLVIGSFAWLKTESGELDKQIKSLQNQKAITTAQRNQLERLNESKQELDQQLQLLTGLRSGAAAEDMFVTIDNALPESNVWITSWRFRRAGTPVDKVDNSVNTGYFIVIPQGGQNNRQQKEETWKIETQMTIQGQSMDHAALSEFVLNLTRQRQIEDVRVVRTQLTEINRTKLVSFTLEIVVSSLQRNA